jgi:hypothetical protein
MKACAADVVMWVNDWVWTYDPRKTPSSMPFDLFPRQEEFLRWLEYLEREGVHGVAEKSRDVGFTWLCAAFAVHRWLFFGAKIAFGSRKEGLVDQLGNPDTIFAKVRFIIEHLPLWMLPAGFSKAHDNYLRLLNPVNGGAITGEGGDNMGRGGRSRIYFVDEAAFIDRPQKVDAAVSNNSDVVVSVSTANGEGNPFHTKVTTWPADRVFRFHWRDDPRKDDAWYQKMKDTLDPVTLAQEVDIDYAAARESVTIPRAWIAPANGRALYPEEKGAIILGCDIAEFGSDKSAVAVREGRNVVHLEEWQGLELEATKNRIIAIAKQQAERLGAGHRLYLFVDAIGVGAGVASGLRAYLNENTHLPWQAVSVNVQEESPEPRCRRLKDALWWRARGWFEKQAPAINPEVRREWRDKLVQELSTPGYKLDSAGLIQIESKDQMAKRGVRSPNLADALVMTFRWEAMKPEAEPRGRQGWRDSWSGAGDDWSVT